MIYLDHASATPLSKKALITMLPYFSEQFFNPSSPYLPANHVRKNYEYAKGQIAHAIGAKGNDIVITAGATESINLAFTALDDIIAADGKKPNVLVLEIEHASVLATAEQKTLEKGFELRRVKVDQTGYIKLDDFRKKLDHDTVFVSVALANNELGTIQPLAEISDLIDQERQQRFSDSSQNRAKSLPLFFHSDASQALNLCDISVSRLGVDLLTINSAKIGGPKGVGALYISHNVHLQPIIFGGGQEAGLRSGTENVPGVIGFSTAITEAKEHLSSNHEKYEKLRQILHDELIECEIEPIFLGNKKHQLVNYLPVSFPGVDAERLIYKLEEKQVYLSTGAACAANKGTKSHVLSAIGLTEEEINGSLRISLGVLNNEEDVRTAGKLICKAVTEELLRKTEEKTDE